MILVTRGRYRAREARDGAEIHRCQELRHLAFREARGLTPLPTRRDADDLDPLCQHLMVEDEAGCLVACLRYLVLRGENVMRGYAARFYDLRRLGSYPAVMIEAGRFCVRPGRPDPAIVCAALSALLRAGRMHGAGLFFGCVSFDGARPERHAEALGILARRHLAPPWLCPPARSSSTLRLTARHLDHGQLRKGQLPPLLRAYLSLGGRVSDWAVIDRELDTLHVFLAVETERIPSAWRRRLRDPGPLASHAGQGRCGRPGAEAVPVP